MQKEYIKFLGLEIELKVYYIIQVCCIAILAVISVITFISLRKSDFTFFRYLWIIALVGIPLELLETFILSRNKRYKKEDTSNDLSDQSKE